MYTCVGVATYQYRTVDGYSSFKTHFKIRDTELHVSEVTLEGQEDSPVQRSPFHP
jgi:hypothetical protein